MWESQKDVAEKNRSKLFRAAQDVDKYAGGSIDPYSLDDEDDSVKSLILNRTLLDLNPLGEAVEEGGNGNYAPAMILAAEAILTRGRSRASIANGGSTKLLSGSLDNASNLARTGGRRASPTFRPKKGNSPWSKGKLKSHFDDHGAEVGATSAKQYSEMAVELGTRSSNGLRQGTHGAFLYRFDPATSHVFVGTIKGGLVKTFYKWDGRSNDAVINALKDAGTF